MGRPQGDQACPCINRIESMNVTRGLPPWDEIRSEYELGASQRSLSIKYGVARTTIQHRINRENWDRSIMARELEATQPAQQPQEDSSNDKADKSLTTRQQAQEGPIEGGVVEKLTARQKAALRPKPDFTFEDRKACQDVVHTLIWKLMQAVDLVPVEDVRTMRDISMCLRDLKELGVYRYELDVKEQEARIAKLEKEASVEEKDNIVNVVIEPELESFTG